jgi:hypothetical protein
MLKLPFTSFANSLERVSQAIGMVDDIQRRESSQANPPDFRIREVSRLQLDDPVALDVSHETACINATVS